VCLVYGKVSFVTVSLIAHAAEGTCIQVDNCDCDNTVHVVHCLDFGVAALEELLRATEVHGFMPCSHVGELHLEGIALRTVSLNS
jgi:hypothetical protein